MRLLLDTQALLWWLGDAGRLPVKARQEISEAANTVAVSAASVWEAEVKRQQGKLDVSVDWEEQLELGAFLPLHITFAHGVAAAQLPLHHRDPFDRMLVAQARLESLTLVTGDTRLRRYDVPVLWD